MLLPDGGRGYLSKIFNDEWMADYGFLRTDERAHGRRRAARQAGADLPALVHMHPNETVREAIDILREYGVSQMPVVKAEPPVMTAEVVGSVVERDLLDALFTGRAQLADPVERHMSPPLPMIGGGEPVVGRRGGAGEGRRRDRPRRRQADRRAHPPGPAGAPRALTRRAQPLVIT